MTPHYLFGAARCKGQRLATCAACTMSLVTGVLISESSNMTHIYKRYKHYNMRVAVLCGASRQRRTHARTKLRIRRRQHLV
eukprot:1187036-Prorocentrum_minimum.AAC.2